MTTKERKKIEPIIESTRWKLKEAGYLGALVIGKDAAELRAKTSSLEPASKIHVAFSVLIKATSADKGFMLAGIYEMFSSIFFML